MIIEENGQSSIADEKDFYIRTLEAGMNINMRGDF